MDIFKEIWPYLEKVGPAGNVLLSVVIVWLVGQIKKRDATIEAERQRNNDIQELRIQNADERVEKLVRTVEQNTTSQQSVATATSANTEVVRISAELIREWLRRGQQ